jgi:hypothetical protein
VNKNFDNIKMQQQQHGVYEEKPVILVTFEQNLFFLEYIFEKKVLKYEISKKSVQSEPSCSTRTDRRIDK